MIELLIVIICLYILYKFVGQYLLPRISERRLARYKRKFFEQNPHIDSDKYDERKRQEEENSSLMTKRRSFRVGD